MSYMWEIHSLINHWEETGRQGELFFAFHTLSLRSGKVPCWLKTELLLIDNHVCGIWHARLQSATQEDCCMYKVRDRLAKHATQLSCYLRPRQGRTSHYRHLSHSSHFYRTNLAHVLHKKSPFSVYLVLPYLSWLVCMPGNVYKYYNLVLVFLCNLTALIHIMFSKNC